jgi:predicted dehydrogenase
VSERDGTGREPLRVGVIGCGLVAQAVHFHYLGELEGRFEVRALCDVSPGALAFSAEHFFPRALRFNDWRELLEQPLDAVMILTPGSHAPIACAALDRGLAVFAEKPLAFSSHETAEVLAAVERTEGCLMVGYMKRYDPAYERMSALVSAMDDLRLVRVTTLEAAIDPYVAHYPLYRPLDVPLERREAFEVEDRERVRRAIGTAADEPGLYWAYRVILLDCLVHEFNAVRGLLGEPSELSFAAAAPSTGALTATLRFGEVQCVLAWVDVPDLANYAQEFALFSPGQRLALSFPSPFLRNARTSLRSEGGEPGGPSAWVMTEHASHESAFKRELIEFYECATTHRKPRTGASDAARDIALCEAFVRAAAEGKPQPAPTERMVVGVQQ